MRAVAAKKGQHDPTIYQVVRVPHRRADAIGVWDGVVVIADSGDERADLDRARNHLETNGLLGCECCSVESGT